MTKKSTLLDHIGIERYGETEVWNNGKYGCMMITEVEEFDSSTSYYILFHEVDGPDLTELLTGHLICYWLANRKKKSNMQIIRDYYAMQKRYYVAEERKLRFEEDEVYEKEFKEGNFREFEKQHFICAYDSLKEYLTKDDVYFLDKLYEEYFKFGDSQSLKNKSESPEVEIESEQSQENKSLLDLITTFEERDNAPITKQWEKYKWGSIIVKNEKDCYRVRFVSFIINKEKEKSIIDGMQNPGFKISEYSYNNGEKVAAGLTAYWLYHRTETSDLLVLASNYYDEERERSVSKAINEDKKSAVDAESQYVNNADMFEGKHFFDSKSFVEALPEEAQSTLHTLQEFYNEIVVRRRREWLFRQDKIRRNNIRKDYETITLNKGDEECLRFFISDHSKQNWYYPRVWANGEEGIIIRYEDSENLPEYRFFRTDYIKELLDEEELIKLVVILEGETEEEVAEREEQKKQEMLDDSPELCCGFISYILEHVYENAEDIYQGYFDLQFKPYEDIALKDPDADRAEIKRNFAKEHIDRLTWDLRISQPLFDYLTPLDKNIIERYVSRYTEYVLKQCGVSKKDVSLSDGKKSTSAKKKTPKERELMTFTTKGIMKAHLQLLYYELVKEEWIDCSQDNFELLFSGEKQELSIIWLGKYGVSTLERLFKALEDDGHVQSGAFAISSILEGHFKDKSGKFISGLGKGNKANDKAEPVIQKCVKLLNLNPTRAQEIEDTNDGVYDPHDQQDLRLHRRY